MADKNPKLKEQLEIVEAVKDMCWNTVADVLDHFIESHTYSEREQELLRDFAGSIQDSIETIEPDTSSGKWGK